MPSAGGSLKRSRSTRPSEPLGKVMVAWASSVAYGVSLSGVSVIAASLFIRAKGKSTRRFTVRLLTSEGIEVSGLSRLPILVPGDQPLGCSEELLVLDVPDRLGFLASGRGCQIRDHLPKSPLGEQFA